VTTYQETVGSGHSLRQETLHYENVRLMLLNAKKFDQYNYIISRGYL
jgi:hypothetical protein